MSIDGCARNQEALIVILLMLMGHSVMTESMFIFVIELGNMSINVVSISCYFHF